MGDGRHLASHCASGLHRFRGATHARSETMTGADKVVCQAAALLLLFTLTTLPARAQFGGFGGGGGGGGDMMTQMAPMLEMMKAKMGKRRFGMMMQTVGPMASRMMQNGGGGFGGALGGGIPGGFGGGTTYADNTGGGHEHQPRGLREHRPQNLRGTLRRKIHRDRKSDEGVHRRSRRQILPAGGAYAGIFGEDLDPEVGKDRNDGADKAD